MVSIPPTIAIVVPNRNDARYLTRCLDSILHQTVAPDQLLVIDDQSSDDSVWVMREKLAGVSFATILSNETCLGTMGTLNVGLQHANTDYVLFLSSNDLVEIDLIRHAKTCISQAGSPGVWSARVSVVDEDDRRIGVYPTPVVTLKDAYLPAADCIRLSRRVGHWFTGTTLMYRREALVAIGGFNAAYLGLGDLVAALTIAGLEGAAYSPEPLAVIRPHPGGLMSRTLSDLPRLDALLEKIWRDGRVVAPALFTPAYCSLMERRIRFTAIRTLGSVASWADHLGAWRGFRYRLLAFFVALCGRAQLPSLFFAFILLRPVRDITAILWYRFIKARFLPQYRV